MAITFPRTMLEDDFPSFEFRLEPVTTTNSLYSGKTHVQIVGPGAFWTATYQTRPHRREMRDKYKAWFDSLRGGARTFLAHDPDACFPRNYTTFSGLTRHGGGAFDGTAATTELAANEIAINTLPSTFAVKAGDLVGLIQSGRYGLFRIVEDATAVNGALTATVEPRVNTSLFTTSATVNFAKPVCEMILGNVEGQRSTNVSPISFSGTQRIY